MTWAESIDTESAHRLDQGQKWAGGWQIRAQALAVINPRTRKN